MFRPSARASPKSPRWALTRTVINNTEFSGYYNEEKIFSLNKDETITKKTTVDGELTVGKTKFVPMATASEGLNIVILD